MLLLLLLLLPMFDADAADIDDGDGFTREFALQLHWTTYISLSMFAVHNQVSPCLFKNRRVSEQKKMFCGRLSEEETSQVRLLLLSLCFCIKTNDWLMRNECVCVCLCEVNSIDVRSSRTIEQEP